VTLFAEQPRQAGIETSRHTIEDEHRRRFRSALDC